MVGSTAAGMLRATWRRAAWAAAAAARPRFMAPTRGLRLRGTLPFRLGPVLPGCPNRLRCCCYALHWCGACPLGSMSQTLNLPVACSHIFSVRPLPLATSELGSHLSDLSQPTVKDVSRGSSSLEPIKEPALFSVFLLFIGHPTPLDSLNIVPYCRHRPFTNPVTFLDVFYRALFSFPLTIDLSPP